MNAICGANALRSVTQPVRMPAQEPPPTIRQVQLAGALACSWAHEPPSATTEAAWSAGERYGVVFGSGFGVGVPDAGVLHAHGACVACAEVDRQLDPVGSPSNAPSECKSATLATAQRAHDLVHVQDQ